MQRQDGKQTVWIHPGSKWCVGAFSVTDPECAKVIVAVAEEENSPVALCINADLVGPWAIEALGSAARSMAERSMVPVAVTFSHARSLDMVKLALDLGFSSVMFDGSFLPFSRNVELTAQAVDLAGRAGFAIEGEIGGLADFGKDSLGQPIICVLAEEFVRETGIDSLAVSIPSEAGGRYSLDMEILESLRRRVPGGLTLHDASLLTSQEILAAVAAGVTKLSFAACLRKPTADGLRPAWWSDPWLRETVRQRLRLLVSAGPAASPPGRTLI